MIITKYREGRCQSRFCRDDQTWTLVRGAAPCEDSLSLSHLHNANNYTITT